MKKVFFIGGVHAGREHRGITEAMEGDAWSSIISVERIPLFSFPMERGWKRSGNFNQELALYADHICN